MKKLFLLSLLSLFFISCQIQVPLSADYWTNTSKVGIMVNVNPAAKFRQGSQGLLDLALTSGDKYQPVLANIDKTMNPQQDLINMYTEILKSKGKEVVLIDEKFDAKTAPKFDKSNADKSKKYSNYDFRALKSKYGVDEVLFVNVNYGMMISYYSMIETGRAAYTYFDTRLVNLTDNSLYLANDNVQMTPIKGKWDVPPAYENVMTNMKATIDKAMTIEKTVVK